MAMTKKKTVLIELVKAAWSVAIPKSGWSARAASEVAAIGIASVTQRRRVTANSAAIRCPAGDNPEGVGSASTTAPAPTAAARARSLRAESVRV